MITAATLPILLAIMIVGLGGIAWLLYRGPLAASRWAVLTISSYVLMGALALVIIIPSFHFHAEPFSLHLHTHYLHDAIGRDIADCSELNCDATTSVMATFGVLTASFLLNQFTGHGLTRHHKRKADLALSKELTKKIGLGNSGSLFVVKDDSPNAFSYALLEWNRLAPKARDVIVLTTGLLNILDDAELKAVVAHELAHIRARDNRYLFFLNTLSRLMFFDPMIKLIRNRLDRHQEFAADMKAALATRAPVALARALLKVYLHSKLPPLHTLSLLGDNRRSLLLERIDRLVKLADTL